MRSPLWLAAVGLASGCAARLVDPQPPPFPARLDWVFTDTLPLADPELARRTVKMGIDMALLDPALSLDLVTIADAPIRTHGVVELRLGPASVSHDGAVEVLTLAVNAQLMDARGRRVDQLELRCTATGPFGPDPQFARFGGDDPGAHHAWNDDYGAVIAFGRRCGDRIVRDLDQRLADAGVRAR